MSTDNDWFGPTWNTTWNVLDDDGLTENDTSDNVTDGSVGGLPHLLQIEFLDSSFVRSDGGTFNTNFASFDGLCGVDGYLVISGITVFDTQVVVLDVEVQVGEDELYDKLRYL